MARSGLSAIPRHFRFAIVSVLMAAVGIVAFGAGGSAYAQASQSALSRIVIKGEAHEPENGFCATVDWPHRSNLTVFYAFLNAGKSNSIYLARSSYDNGKIAGCSYYRMISTTHLGGKRCVNTMAWACFKGGKCSAVGRTWCRQNNGSWRAMMK